MGRPLFEIMPDVFPGDYMTDTELELWNLEIERKNELMRKG